MLVGPWPGRPPPPPCIKTDIVLRHSTYAKGSGHRARHKGWGAALDLHAVQHIGMPNAVETVLLLFAALWLPPFVLLFISMAAAAKAGEDVPDGRVPHVWTAADGTEGGCCGGGGQAEARSGIGDGAWVGAGPTQYPPPTPQTLGNLPTSIPPFPPPPLAPGRHWVSSGISPDPLGCV